MEASWEPITYIQQNYPNFLIEDKRQLGEGVMLANCWCIKGSHMANIERETNNSFLNLFVFLVLVNYLILIILVALFCNFRLVLSNVCYCNTQGDSVSRN